MLRVLAFRQSERYVNNIGSFSINDEKSYTKTPQIKILIGQTRKKKRAARVACTARTLQQFRPLNFFMII